MNTRLKKTLEENELRGGEFLDCYNKTVHDGIATTIKTNVITSCNYFIYEESEQ